MTISVGCTLITIKRRNNPFSVTMASDGKYLKAEGGVCCPGIYGVIINSQITYSVLIFCSHSESFWSLQSAVLVASSCSISKSVLREYYGISEVVWVERNVLRKRGVGWFHVWSIHIAVYQNHVGVQRDTMVWWMWLSVVQETKFSVLEIKLIRCKCHS